jgi:exodeoxyribonuclease VII small subunit
VPKQTTRAVQDEHGEERGVPDEPNADVAGLTYEQARDELVAVVARLESGAETLEESLALWERGEALAARCQQWLDGARDRLAAARGEQGRTAGDGAGSRGDAAGPQGDARRDDPTTDDGMDEA